MLELLFSALICVVEYSIFIMILQHYLNDRWERSRKLFCFKFLGLLICSVTLTFINTFQNSLWNVLTVFTLTFILSCIFYQGKWLVKIFLAVVTCTLSLISEFITMVTGSAIFGENLTVIVTLPSVQVPMTIISKVLLFTLVRIIFLIKRGKKYTRIGKASLLLYTLPVVTVANIILMVQLEYYAPSEESHKVLMAFVCIGLILCNIAVFFIYDKNLKKYELENQLRQAQEMQRLQASYYMQLEKSLNESRKQMHDFKNHITTLEHLHQGKENTKAVSYMQELQQQMKEQMNLLFIVIRIIFIFTKDRKYAKSGKEVLFLFTLPIVTIANIILMVKLESYVPQKESHKILMSLVCFGLILCNIAVFFIYGRNLRKYELENQLREAEEMQRIQASYYKQIEKGLNESRKQLHDFKNHITTLERLYHTDSKDKALNYMHELQAQMSQQMAAASFRVNNTAFDVILYEQEKACKEQGITFEKQILYNDLSILKYIDTCTIFANALDNAVKACSEIQNGEKKITLEVKRTNDILSIIIENTKQNHVVCENEKFVSSKADKHNHGF